MSSYVQISQLDFALGGVIVMDGYPLPPLIDMPNESEEEAKKQATYYGNDMRWMIWEGEDDYIFPPNKTMTTYQNVFEKLGVTDTWKIRHIEPGMGHWFVQKEFDQMIRFINGGTESNKVSQDFLA